MQKNFTTDVGIFFLKLVARLPFPVIYFLSDILYFVVFYIVKYRKEVVLQNLKNSFPEKTTQEIKTIRKKHYRHFCDLVMESVKMFHMTKSDYERGMEIGNPEIINEYFEKGKSVVVLTMHYNNWEWSNCFPREVKHRILGVYKPLHNERFDKLMTEAREEQGTEMVPNAKVLRRVIKAQQDNELVFTWLAGDQTPPAFHSHWFTFLNQEAMFYPGPAFISKRFNQPVFYHKIEKKSRGKYISSFELLVENPQDFSENEILARYIQKMEEIIRIKPEFYLWSHRRWKHKRPEDIPLSN